jgi:hypothetical protein
LGSGSNDHQVDDGDCVLERLADKELPHHAGLVWVHEHAEARLNPVFLFKLNTVVLMVKERLNCAGRRYAIESFERVFLNDSETQAE